MEKELVEINGENKQFTIYMHHSNLTEQHGKQELDWVHNGAQMNMNHSLKF